MELELKHFYLCIHAQITAYRLHIWVGGFFEMRSDFYLKICTSKILNCYFNLKNLFNCLTTRPNQDSAYCCNFHPLYGKESLGCIVTLGGKYSQPVQKKNSVKNLNASFSMIPSYINLCSTNGYLRQTKCPLFRR